MSVRMSRGAGETFNHLCSGSITFFYIHSQFLMVVTTNAFVSKSAVNRVHSVILVLLCIHT